MEYLAFSYKYLLVTLYLVTYEFIFAWTAIQVIKSLVRNSCIIFIRQVFNDGENFQNMMKEQSI